MTHSEAAALVNATAILYQVELGKMQAANQLRAHNGESPAYTEDAFEDLHKRADQELCWNTIATIFRDAYDI